MSRNELLAQARSLMKECRFAESAAAFEELLRGGDDPLHRTELALVYTKTGRFGEAEALARGVLSLFPDFGLAHAALGFAQYERRRPDLAMPHVRRALELDPDLHTTRQLLGNCLMDLGRRREARACFDAVCALDPANPIASFGRGISDLVRRCWHRGWLNCEWRWQTNQGRLPKLPRPRWDGRDLAGKCILIHNEQGVGDTVHLARLLPLLKSRANARRVQFTGERRVVDLLRGSIAADDWFPYGERVDITFDVWSPLISLPFLLGLDETNLPHEPYLKPEPERVAKWKPVVEAIPGFKIGVGWAGQPQYLGDAYRSIPLSHFEKLAAIPGVTLVNLQRVNGLEQVAANRERVPLVELDGLDDGAPFRDTLAVLPMLDLTVGCDSALIHLAGAAGATAFLALSIGHDWRWLMRREDSPWYPRVRLFRQTAFQDWAGVFERMADAVREGLRVRTALSPPRTEALTVAISAGELLDRIVALELEAERSQDEMEKDKLLEEFDQLTALRDRHMPASPELDDLTYQLSAAIRVLCDLEERLRKFVQAGDFGPAYVTDARRRIDEREHRNALRNAIDAIFGLSPPPPGHSLSV